MQEGQCVFQERGPTWLLAYHWVIALSLGYCFIMCLFMYSLFTQEGAMCFPRERGPTWSLVYHSFIDSSFVYAGGGNVFFGNEGQHGTPLSIFNGGSLSEAATGTPVCVVEAATVGTNHVRVLTLCPPAADPGRFSLSLSLSLPLPLALSFSLSFALSLSFFLSLLLPLFPPSPPSLHPCRTFSISLPFSPSLPLFLSLSLSLSLSATGTPVCVAEAATAH